MSSSARIDELRKKFDENPRRYFAPLANEYRKAGDFEQAVFICQEYLPQQPGHMSGHIVYGQTLFDMGRDEEARAVFETALTLDPENLIALKHLGDIARQAGDVEGARSWYQRVLEADPRNDEIMQVLESIAGADAGLGGGAAVASSASGNGQSSSVSFSDAAPAFPSSADEADDQAEVPPLPVTEMAEQSEEMEPLVLEQSGDADFPVAMPETSTVSSVADVSDEPTPELLDLADFSFGVSESSSDSEPEPAAEPVMSGGAIDIGDFASDALSVEASAEDAAADDQQAPEPDIELGTDIILGLSDDSPASPAQPEVSAFEVEPTPVANENLTRAIDQLEGLESFSIDVPPPLPPIVDEPAVESSDEAAAAASPDTFATETMADLYAQQGHLESAMEIYGQLLERSPDDAELRRRASDVERQLLGAPEAVASEALVDDIVVPSASDETIEEPADIEQADIEPASPVVAGPTIRDFFLEILAGRDADAAGSETAAEDLEIPGDFPSVESEGSLDILFSDVATDESDHSAAMSLAQAFGGDEENDDSAALRGTPAHPATDELSLDHVFRSATPAKGSASAGAFSLDQFFAGETSDAEMPENSSEGSGAHRATDDIAQFNAWLNGLKKT
jgi:tetratricopeptide (TPR) repeat protein